MTATVSQRDGASCRPDLESRCSEPPLGDVRRLCGRARGSPVRVRFWGTRGSIPTPGSGTVRYGGNTSCVEVRSAAGTLLVLDCGTGGRALGQALAAEGAEAGKPVGGALLIGHTHWDHIQGLPFFTPLFQPGSRWDLYGPRGLGASLADTLAGQMQYQYFPVTLDQMGADIGYHDLVEGTFEVGDLTITAHYLNHPALTLGYRIEGDGVTVVYSSDHEPHDRNLAGGGDLGASSQDARHLAFLQDADLVIHDTQYEAAEYAAKVGWGHSTMEYVVDAARLAGVEHLVLYHHDPAREDAAVDGMLERARARGAAAGYGGRIDAAAEGEAIDVRPTARPRRASAAASRATHVPAIEDVTTGVVLAVADPAVASAVAGAAAAEHLPVERCASAEDLRRAVERAARAVLVVDVDSDADAARVERAAETVGDGSVAVVALTRRLLPLRAAPHVTDWVVWPASVAHLRTKLRSAVLRRACRWQAAPLPPDEDRRVEALHRLGVLDTPAEDRFDRYTAAARDEFSVPIALITLVDGDRQWFKSRIGFDIPETSRDQSVCAHAILGPDILQVPDLLLDDRFAESPAVVGPDHVRFYAGAPLTLSDGSRVGTLCIADRRPRLLDDRQLARLRELADQVQADLDGARSVP